MAKKVKRIKTLAEIIAAEIKAYREAQITDVETVIDDVVENVTYSPIYQKMLRNLVRAAL